jgi:hypothetical protein
MAGRYLITGVQLGMLIGLEDSDSRQRLVNIIEKNQYLGYSGNDILNDVKSLYFENNLKIVRVEDKEYKLSSFHLITLKKYFNEKEPIVAVKYLREQLSLDLRDAKFLWDAIKIEIEQGKIK